MGREGKNSKLLAPQKLWKGKKSSTTLSKKGMEIPPKFL